MFENLPVERWFEDYVTGAVHELGSVEVTEAECIAFANRYDPQPIHVDPIGAAQSQFGGIIASGWMTGGLFMRMYVEQYLSRVTSIASPGIDEVRWPRPVRPGDTLRARVTVLGTRRSTSKPDRGVVHSGIEVLNQHGDVVMSFKAVNLVYCRERR
ncbi:MAG: MaoC family dehydratase [Gammaproteobacteria bacterium]|nr:MaoC family dehydratase [Gammaproteobacteria bacterium]